VIYAEKCPYWKTSKTSPETWLDRAEAVLVKFGGTVNLRFMGRVDDRDGFLLGFIIGPNQFRIDWPVLPTKSGTKRQAQIQAATMIYHDVKARVVSAEVLGARAAFLTFLVLPSGEVAGDVSDRALAHEMGKFPIALPSGEE
jgi:hypothetical protein